MYEQLCGAAHETCRNVAMLYKCAKTDVEHQWLF
jgi:hypothetical protein